MILSNHRRNMFQCNALGTLLEDGSVEHSTMRRQGQWCTADASSGYEQPHHQTPPACLFISLPLNVCNVCNRVKIKQCQLQS